MQRVWMMMMAVVAGSRVGGPINAAPPVSTPHQPPPHQHQPPKPRRASAPVLGKPPIEFHPELLDLGTIQPGERVTASVYMHNVSEKTLKVLYAKPDCSCTAANVSSDTIAPGQPIVLEVEYHATSVMGPWKGEIRVGIDGYDMVAIPAKAMVAMQVRAEPPYISAVPDVETGVRPLTGMYTVFSMDRQPFRILAVNGEPPPYVDFDPQKDEPRDAYQLKWDFSQVDLRSCRDKSGKRVPGWIVVETDHPQCAVFDLEVRHECNARTPPKRTDSWFIQEKRVLVGVMKPGEASEFEVAAKWFPRESRDAIKTVVSETPQLSAELVSVVEVADGFVCTVRVTPAESHRGLVYGVVRLHASAQNMPITVIGVARAEQ